MLNSPFISLCPLFPCALSLFYNLQHFHFTFRVSVSLRRCSLFGFFDSPRIFSANFRCHLLPRRRIFNFSFLDRALFRFLIFALPSAVTLSFPLFYFPSSIRLFIRFYSPIVHTFTIAPLYANLFLALSAFPSA